MLVSQCDADENILIATNSKDSLVAKFLMSYYLLLPRKKRWPQSLISNCWSDWGLVSVSFSCCGSTGVFVSGFDIVKPILESAWSKARWWDDKSGWSRIDRCFTKLRLLKCLRSRAFCRLVKTFLLTSCCQLSELSLFCLPMRRRLVDYFAKRAW